MSSEIPELSVSHVVGAVDSIACAVMIPQARAVGWLRQARLGSQARAIGRKAQPRSRLDVRHGGLGRTCLPALLCLPVAAGHSDDPTVGCLWHQDYIRNKRPTQQTSTVQHEQAPPPPKHPNKREKEVVEEAPKPTTSTRPKNASDCTTSDLTGVTPHA